METLLAERLADLRSELSQGAEIEPGTLTIDRVALESGSRSVVIAAQPILVTPRLPARAVSIIKTSFEADG